MIKIQHVIFSRVEPKYSPTQTGGFQIVYQSTDLQQNEVDFIEKKVQCFIYNGNMDLIRYQFFKTQNGLIALAKTVPIKSDPDIIDSKRRGGAFIAHILLLSHIGFEQIHNDPFAIFSLHPGVFTDTALKLKHYLTSAPPPNSIEAKTRRTAENPPSLSLSQWYELTNVANHAETDFIETGKSLFVKTGTSQEIHDLLAAWILLVPFAKRLACTFDTHVDSCEPEAGNFWLLGGTKPNNSSHDILDVARLNVNAIQLSKTVKDSPYLRWFESEINKHQSTTDFFGKVATIQPVIFCLDHKQMLPDQTLNEAALQDFYNINRVHYDRKLTAILEKALPKQLVNLFQADIQDYIPIKDVFSIIANEHISSYLLADSFFKWLKSHQNLIENWKLVLDFGLEVNSPQLQLISLPHVYTKRGPLTNLINNIESIRVNALHTLIKQDNSQHVLKDLASEIPIHWLISDQTMQIVISSFIDKHYLQNLSDEQFEKLVRAIIENQGGTYLNKDFASRTHQVRAKKTAKNLKKLAKKSKIPLPTEFEGALAELS